MVSAGDHDIAQNVLEDDLRMMVWIRPRFCRPSGKRG
jgi:hypothetical protein